jgi:hypothetical protein
MPTRQFRYDDVLSVSDGRLVSQRGMRAVYEVMGHLVGNDVSTLAITYLGESAQKHLAAHYPFLGTPDVRDAVTAALAVWQTNHPADKDATLMPAFLDKYVLPLMPGEFLDVAPMADDDAATLENGYGEWLDVTLAGKTVIGVVV